MNKSGPIVIIEDDIDDQAIFQEVFENLNYPNKVIYFNNGQDALEFLNNVDVLPFLILSDINMPKLNGMELREKLRTDASLQVKCIPYLFFTTGLNQKAVIDAYSLSVQGFFVKQDTLEATQNSIAAIVEYWKMCAAPNSFE